MGLDMYLYRKTYVKNWDWKKDKWDIDIKYNGEPYDGIDKSKICFVTEEVAYWRKANQVHKWFVDHCQSGVDDCREAYVEVEKLEELLNLCKKIKSRELVPALALPTESGFFFGGTEYDEWYDRDIDETIRQLQPLIDHEHNRFKDDLWGGEYYYHSSW